MSAPPQCKKCTRRCCAICGSTKDVEEHHLGGRNHAAYFTIPLCRVHHEAVTILIARARVSMQPTSDTAERARLARQAVYVFLWFLDDAVTANPRSKKA